MNKTQISLKLQLFNQIFLEFHHVKQKISFTLSIFQLSSPNSTNISYFLPYWAKFFSGNGKVYDTLYNPPQQAAPRKVPPVKPNSLRSDPIGMEDEIKLGNSRNHHLMSSQLDSPTNHQRSPNASPHLTEKDIEPAGLQPKLKPSKEEINERVTRSLQGPKSIIYEAYFIFGVLCGIICLTVLIAETDKPRTSGKSRLIGPLPQAESEMDEVVRLTNTWASWLRDTRLFGAFHEAIYGPIKERLVYYFSWLFQI